MTEQVRALGRLDWSVPKEPFEVEHGNPFQILEEVEK